jgi:hypothetical protein
MALYLNAQIVSKRENDGLRSMRKPGELLGGRFSDEAPIWANM